MRFIPEIPAFLVLGVRMSGDKCVVIACERLYNWHVTQRMEFGWGTETQIEAVLGPFISIEGATFEECFDKMTRGYRSRGGRFTDDQYGLLLPTPELEER